MKISSHAHEIRSWYLLGVLSKISEECPFIFIWESLLPGFVAQLGDLLQFDQCKPKQNNNNFVFLLLLGTRISHRKIPELEKEEEIRG